MPKQQKKAPSKTNRATAKPVKKVITKAKATAKSTTKKAAPKAKATSKAKTINKTKKPTQAKTMTKTKTTNKAAKPVSKPKDLTKTKQPVAKTKVVSKAPAKAHTKSKPVKPIAETKKTIAGNLSKNSAGPVGFEPYKETSGEEYMNDKQREHFRRILLLWKQQLFAERDSTVMHMQDEVMNFPDPLDRASLEEEYTLELRARDRERKFIKKIDEALERIDAGDYGYCIDCDAEIGIRRLEARPTATQCIDCKTIDEIKERQTGVIE